MIEPVPTAFECDHCLWSAGAGPNLMGSGEIAARLGLSRQRVSQLAVLPSFPVPYRTLRAGRIWLEPDVEGWIRLSWRGVQ